MPRANRHYIPGCVWHITHRCHKQEFLLKFDKDKRCWRRWLFEAKKRYDLCVLNYTITSNHIHLLVVDTDEDVISKSLQLVAGRTAQEYNIRKKRKGAFWEGRYHATAVQSDGHLKNVILVRPQLVDMPNHFMVRPHGGKIMDVRQIIEGAKYLNAKEKAMVAHCLISSLETRQDEGVDQAWAELAQKRFAELASGEVESVSWEDIKKKVKEQHGRDAISSGYSI